MAPQAAIAFSDLDERAISPFLEMGAYEYLWDNDAANFKNIAEKFAAHPNAIPSDFVPAGKALEKAAYVRRTFAEAGIKNFGVRVHGAGEYPQKLRVAQHPVELLYYQGWWDLVESRSVAVVGTREPSPEG